MAHKKHSRLEELRWLFDILIALKQIPHHHKGVLIELSDVVKYRIEKEG